MERAQDLEAAPQGQGQALPIISFQTLGKSRCLSEPPHLSMFNGKVGRKRKLDSLGNGTNGTAVTWLVLGI